MRASAFLIGLVMIVLGGRAVAAERLEVQPVIGGNPMRCYDFRGAVVRTLQTTDLGDVGRASIIARMPIISLARPNPLVDGRQSERAMLVRRGVQRLLAGMDAAVLPEICLASGRLETGLQ